MTSRKSFRRAVATTLAAAALGTISSQACAFDVARIMNVIKYPNNWANHKVLMSHRGIVGSGCPENSTCSIQKVLDSGVVEAIELDVKAASDGKLWLLHDQNLGRMVNPSFDMYTGSGSNPDISTMSSDVLATYKLKDRSFAVTGYYMKTLTAGLQQTAGIVTVLDLKTESAAITASTNVRTLGVQNRVILKVSSGWNPSTPSKVGSQFGGVPFAITLYTGNLDAVVNGYKGDVCAVGSSCSAHGVVTSWVDAAIKSNGAGFMFLEIGAKNPADTTDPLTWFVNGYLNSLVATSQFMPYPEYLDSSADLQNGYVRSNSTCCASLSEYLSSSSYFGSESYDRRPYNLWGYFDSTLTDNVVSLHNTLNALGYRKLSYYD